MESPISVGFGAFLRPELEIKNKEFKIMISIRNCTISHFDLGVVPGGESDQGSAAPFEAGWAAGSVSHDSEEKEDAGAAAEERPEREVWFLEELALPLVAPQGSLLLLDVLVEVPQGSLVLEDVPQSSAPREVELLVVFEEVVVPHGSDAELPPAGALLDPISEDESPQSSLTGFVEEEADERPGPLDPRGAALAPVAHGLLPPEPPPLPPEDPRLSPPLGHS